MSMTVIGGLYSNYAAQEKKNEPRKGQPLVLVCMALNLM